MAQFFSQTQGWRVSMCIVRPVLNEQTRQPSVALRARARHWVKIAPYFSDGCSRHTITEHSDTITEHADTITEHTDTITEHTGCAERSRGVTTQEFGSRGGGVVSGEVPCTNPENGTFLRHHELVQPSPVS